MFEALRLEIEKDIKTRNDLLRPAQKQRYSFGMTAVSGGFTVFVEGIAGSHYTVMFTIAEDKVLVRDETGKSVLEAIPTVCDDGKCRLKINGQERKLWQVRKTALEDLFFHAY